MMREWRVSTCSASGTVHSFRSRHSRSSEAAGTRVQMSSWQLRVVLQWMSWVQRDSPRWLSRVSGVPDGVSAAVDEALSRGCPSVQQLRSRCLRPDPV